MRNYIRTTNPCESKTHKQLMASTPDTPPTEAETVEESTVVDTTTAKVRYNRKTGKEYVNQYELHRKLGQGAYGTVFLAVDTDITPPRKAALKVMNTKQLIKKKGSELAAKSVLQGLPFPLCPHLTLDFSDLKREIAIMKKLNHPNVVKLFEVIDDPKSENIYLGLYPFTHYFSLIVLFIPFSNGVLFRRNMFW